MGTATSKVDYAGRTVDLLLLKTVLDAPVANKRVELDVSNVKDEPMIVSGVEKMVQRFAIAFINAIGSTKFVHDHGTSIVPTVAKGKVYDMSTLQAAAAEANLMARQQTINGDFDEETPADERLVGSDVEDLEFSREKAMVRISIRLTTEAGNDYIYVIPVPVGVRG